MSGLFSTLNVANKGLFAAQTSLHTTGHNISNANTRGFNRQRVEMKASLAYNLGGVGQLGTGVKMESITRVIDDYVVKQIRNESGTFERYASKSEVIDQLEVIFNEPSTTGLNFYLGEMFDSWQELSKNPESLNSRTIVVEKGKALADTINHMSRQISSLKDETVGQIEKNAKDFNAIVEKLDALNKQIFNIGVTGDVPNDLLDQRDLMLQDLGGIGNIKPSFDKYGRVTITYADGTENGIKVLGTEATHKLSVVTEVVENQDGTFTVSISPGGDSLVDPVTIENLSADDMAGFELGAVLFTRMDQPIDGGNIIKNNGLINSGRIQGNTDALGDIDDAMNSLNQFAKTMANAMNKIHTGDGQVADSVDFFVYDEANPSTTITISQEIQSDHSKVLVGADYNSPEGDGSRALAMARLRNTKLDFTSENPTLTYDPTDMSIAGNPGGITVEDGYGNIVINIGISKEHSDNVIANQDVLLGQLEMRRESVSGVSINEEISNVIKYQSAYEANARVIQVLSEMLDVLINRTGV
ncbi:MAG: flagellar hook-associated protein FlgK [Tissierella sp.]|nr:flagellar hook-associated protein FlgK [Tissierella sp.]